MTKLKIRNRKILRASQWLPFVRSRKSKALLAILTTVALGSLLLLALPYLPRLRFLLFRPKVDASAYAAAVEQQKTNNTTAANPPQIKEKGNRLVIPNIGVNAQIFDGSSIGVIAKNQGVWHESKNINPATDGNMVIAGHRWMYTPSVGGYFYSIPELKAGDKMYLRWGDKVYEYEVYNHKTVNPTQIDIRDNDPAVKHKLTLYTCHPLGTASKRYVVEAKLLE